MNRVRFQSRHDDRFACAIPISACTVIDSRSATITDLSNHGAQIDISQPYSTGQLIHIDLDGDFAWARVQWSEVDRMGVKFVTPLAPGQPLSRILQHLQKQKFLQTRPALAPQRGFGRKAA